MADVFDLYGILDTDIDAVAATLASALEVAFNPHDSSYWGEYYLAHTEDYKEKLSLKENFNKMEEDWNEPEFKDYPLILEANLPLITRAREIEEYMLKAMGSKAVLLRREEFPD
ncbi:MAG: hypothetical protein H0W02_06745 [Ktedonobacteraceae bacterium]|nr:hypothetical protein [Ktedonobacteraceae bacterium]